MSWESSTRRIVGTVLAAGVYGSVLLMVIGVELARTLLTHDLGAILELLAFVVAWKTLKPDVDAFDIFLCALAFVALLAARYYFLRPAPEQSPP